MVSSGYTGCNAAATITMLSLGLASTGLVYSGASLTQMEFATPYAGIVTAIANTFANTPGFLSPMIAGVVTENQVRMKGRRDREAEEKLERRQTLYWHDNNNYYDP